MGGGGNAVRAPRAQQEIGKANYLDKRLKPRKEWEGGNLDYPLPEAIFGLGRKQSFASDRGGGGEGGRSRFRGGGKGNAFQYLKSTLTPRAGEKGWFPQSRMRKKEAPFSQQKRGKREAFSNTKLHFRSEDALR